MKILVDGDIIKYRCGFAGEKTRYEWWHEDDVTIGIDDAGSGSYITKSTASPVATFENAKDAKEWIEAVDPSNNALYIRIPRKQIEPIENVLHSVKMVMKGIHDKFPKGNMVVYFSCPTPENWRTAFYPEYKANRPDRRPFWSEEIQEYLNENFVTVRGAGYEADDLIAMEAAKALDKGLTDNFVVVTIDKDLDQIPGSHYNWVTQHYYYVDDVEALRLLARQAVSGDATDNIKGVPGMGPKKAEEFLRNAEGPDGVSEAESMGHVVGQAYSTYYKNPNEAYYHAMLNIALVTLPPSEEARNTLVRRVYGADKARTVLNECSQ